MIRSACVHRQHSRCNRHALFESARQTACMMYAICRACSVSLLLLSVRCRCEPLLLGASSPSARRTMLRNTSLVRSVDRWPSATKLPSEVYTQVLSRQELGALARAAVDDAKRELYDKAANLARLSAVPVQTKLSSASDHVAVDLCAQAIADGTLQHGITSSGWLVSIRGNQRGDAFSTTVCQASSFELTFQLTIVREREFQTVMICM